MRRPRLPPRWRPIAPGRRAKLVVSPLVERAAAVAADTGDLERRLARELDSAEDRERFLKAKP